MQYKLVHDRRLAKEVHSHLTFGKLLVTYSNNALSTISDTLIGFKSLPSFRDVTLIPDCLLPKSAQESLLTPDSAKLIRESKQEQARYLDELAKYERESNVKLAR